MTQHSQSSEENFNKASPPVYETTDFYLASYLKSVGYSLAGLGKSGRRTIFKFEDKPERKRTVLSYFNGEGSVSPQILISAIKEMKALIHSVG